MRKRVISVVLMVTIATGIVTSVPVYAQTYQANAHGVNEVNDKYTSEDLELQEEYEQIIRELNQDEQKSSRAWQVYVKSFLLKFLKLVQD